MYLKTIDKIVWFIPFRNLRDNIRYKLINKYTKYYKEKKFLLNEIKDINIQKNIFKVNVNAIEIEIHSYCNRKCWFCPNSTIDRHSQLIELDEKIYLNILSDLKNIEYSELLTFHQFNEPLANRNLIINRVKQARNYLPKAILKIFTNGDYLTIDYLDKLKSAGINEIVASYYTNKDVIFDVEKNIKPKIENIVDKLGLKIKEILSYSDNNFSVLIDYDGINFTYKANNFSASGNTRGGLVSEINVQKNKKFICNSFIDHFHVNYNGLVMPCCNLRSDAIEHKSMIIGNLSNNSSIFEIYTNNKAAEIRKYLLNFSEKQSPCDTCNIY